MTQRMSVINWAKNDSDGLTQGGIKRSNDGNRKARKAVAELPRCDKRTTIQEERERRYPSSTMKDPAAQGQFLRRCTGGKSDAEAAQHSKVACVQYSGRTNIWAIARGNRSHGEFGGNCPQKGKRPEYIRQTFATDVGKAWDSQTLARGSEFGTSVAGYWVSDMVAFSGPDDKAKHIVFPKDCSNFGQQMGANMKGARHRWRTGAP